MAILVSLARERRCVVVCSLHAPRSAIFSGIHHLLLLSAGGRVCYHGPAHDAGANPSTRMRRKETRNSPGTHTSPWGEYPRGAWTVVLGAHSTCTRLQMLFDVPKQSRRRAPCLPLVSASLRAGLVVVFHSTYLPLSPFPHPIHRPDPIACGPDAVPYFAQLGHACPAFYNPADFLVDLICVDTAPEDEGQTQARVRALQCAWEQRPAQEGNAPPVRLRISPYPTIDVPQGYCLAHGTPIRLQEGPFGCDSQRRILSKSWERVTSPKEL